MSKSGSRGTWHSRGGHAGQNQTFAGPAARIHETGPLTAPNLVYPVSVGDSLQPEAPPNSPTFNNPQVGCRDDILPRGSLHLCRLIFGEKGGPCWLAENLGNSTLQIDLDKGRAQTLRYIANEATRHFTYCVRSGILTVSDSSQNMLSTMRAYYAASCSAESEGASPSLLKYYLFEKRIWPQHTVLLIIHEYVSSGTGPAWLWVLVPSAFTVFSVQGR